MAYKKKYNIIEDNPDYIIVDKAAGILTIPGRHTSADDLRTLLYKDLGQEFFPVHRIDKDTSGLVIMTKNPDVHKSINDLFAQRAIHKKYKVFVSGRMFVDEATLDHPILEKSNGLSQVDENGKPSITHIKVLEKFRTATYIEAIPVTGRTHQIRVHLQHSGFPLLVDPQYGHHNSFYLSTIKRKRFNLRKDETERPLISRLTLHSSEVSWAWKGTQVNYVCSLPKDLSALLNQLRKWDNY